MNQRITLWLPLLAMSTLRTAQPLAPGGCAKIDSGLSLSDGRRPWLLRHYLRLKHAQSCGQRTPLKKERSGALPSFSHAASSSPFPAVTEYRCCSWQAFVCSICKCGCRLRQSAQHPSTYRARPERLKLGVHGRVCIVRFPVELGESPSPLRSSNSVGCRSTFRVATRRTSRPAINYPEYVELASM